MRIFNVMPVVFLAFLLSIAHGYVFEGQDSGDVEFFLDEDPAQYRGLLFYNQDQYDEIIDQMILKIQTIFEDPFDQNFTGESWIQGIPSGPQLMRIDMRNIHLARIVEHNEITENPAIVLFDENDLMTNEVITNETYNNLKLLLTNMTLDLPVLPLPVPEPVSEQVPETKENIEVVPASENMNSIDESSPMNCPAIECPVPEPCPVAPSCTPVPCIPSGPSPLDIESKCQSALEASQEAATKAKEAYEELKQEFDQYRKAVQAEKETTQARCQRGEDIDSVEEARKDIDLFIKIKDSLHALETMKREAVDLEANLKGAQKQIDYRMDDWMRKYERDYINVQERKIKNAERRSYNDGYDQGYDHGHDDGKREGKYQGIEETKKQFIDNLRNNQTKTAKEYKEEFGVDIIGQPRLIGSRLVEKGEPHDPIIIDEYELGDPFNPIFNLRTIPFNSTEFYGPNSTFFYPHDNPLPYNSSHFHNKTSSLPPPPPFHSRNITENHHSPFQENHSRSPSYSSYPSYSAHPNHRPAQTVAQNSNRSQRQSSRSHNSVPIPKPTPAKPNSHSIPKPTPATPTNIPKPTPARPAQSRSNPSKY
ncbi:unnamed protein product [Moneuplotes crassus]|uniref:Uncharacterized protein n=1 Tax=Euplotes crassus TaxID=5936 RepID=A0AAD1U736_EUPCR|nr:unnamed protein product [Moneuplotes crassus]